MSGVVKLLSAADAQRLTQRIKVTASGVRDGLFKLRNLIEEAKHSNAWQILGFASWPAYLVDALGDEPMRVSREERLELVGYLAGEGLSTRAIAPIVGVSQKTADREARTARESFDSPEVPGGGAPADTTDDEARAERIVTGLDGKTYSRPVAEVTVRRSPLIDQFDRAVVDLNRLMDRFARLAADDRLPQNKQQVASMHEGDLSRAVSELQNLLTAISTRKEEI